MNEHVTPSVHEARAAGTKRILHEATATLMLGRKHRLMYPSAYPVALTSESIWLAVHVTQARVLDELLSHRYRHHAASAELPGKQLLP